MTRPLRVLLLEDSQDDARLILHELHRAGFEPIAERVKTEPEFLAHLDAALDIILADYSFPEFDILRRPAPGARECPRCTGDRAHRRHGRRGRRRVSQSGRRRLFAQGPDGPAGTGGRPRPGTNAVSRRSAASRAGGDATVPGASGPRGRPGDPAGHPASGSLDRRCNSRTDHRQPRGL